ncbi:uncharacterized protein BXZ73DRAFT_97657 [Epithele typhae]|uniref:uncharacterized protein n=1 Tax=Epithele typhae TaxID=378194 RepID=UPI002008C816|nr:uncharacterized protein BXZ73DRAFT_97657 [Epithele typhae]KAH9942239.1 hypothetical protein BXZ73DRAFT_97657 [Epithele typhae]
MLPSFKPTLSWIKGDMAKDHSRNSSGNPRAAVGPQANKAKQGKSDPTKLDTKESSIQQTSARIQVTPPSPPLSPEEKRATLPKTPCGDGTTTNGQAETNQAERQLPSADAAAVAVSELLGNMTGTLDTLRKTFEVLQIQTERVAALGPMVGAMNDIRLVKSDLTQQHIHQDHRMEQVRTEVQEKVKAHVRESLRPRVPELVAEIVRREVAERVRRELKEKIPERTREQLRAYKMQVLEAKMRLHNSEARRANALIRSSALHEPLKPLLRPLGVPQPPLSPTATTACGSTRATVGGVAPTPPATLKTKAGKHLTVDTAAHGTGEDDAEMPSSSPLFPRDLATLVQLGADEARALVRDYGLVEDVDEEEEAMKASVGKGLRGGSGAGKKGRPVSGLTGLSDASDWAGREGSREDHLNRFMKYIGVGFQVLPAAGRVVTLGGGSGAATIGSPLIERPEWAFVR